LTTKIVALVDALGNLVRFVLLPGQRHDTIGVAPLIEDIEFAALLADKAFDVDWLRENLNERGAAAVIPPKSNRKIQYEYDKHIYRWRHLVENYFAKIKEFRGIATRYDKTDTSYAANLNLVAAIIAAKSMSTGPSRAKPGHDFPRAWRVGPNRPAYLSTTPRDALHLVCRNLTGSPPSNRRYHPGLDLQHRNLP
jgi:transposase